MKSATFYLLESHEKTVGYRYACHLIHQLWEKQLSAYLYCEDREIAQSLDDLLWTFKDTSFIPHQFLGTLEHSNHSIDIGYKGMGLHSLHQDNVVLINLTEEVPSFYKEYVSILEMVINDPIAKEVARKRYKIYRESNYHLETIRVQ